MYKSISIDEFEQLSKKEKISIIDVREGYEYQMGHVPNAVNLPLSELGTEELTLDKNQEHYIICQSGSRSAGACQYLSSLGYQVTNIMGGTSAWRGGLV